MLAPKRRSGEDVRGTRVYRVDGNERLGLRSESECLLVAGQDGKSQKRKNSLAPVDRFGKSEIDRSRGCARCAELVEAASQEKGEEESVRASRAKPPTGLAAQIERHTLVAPQGRAVDSSEEEISLI